MRLFRRWFLSGPPVKLRPKAEIINESLERITTLVEDGEKIFHLLSGLLTRDDADITPADAQYFGVMMFRFHGMLDRLNRGALNMRIPIEERVRLMKEADELLKSRLHAMVPNTPTLASV